MKIPATQVVAVMVGRLSASGKYHDPDVAWRAFDVAVAKVQALRQAGKHCAAASNCLPLGAICCIIAAVGRN